MNLRNKLKLHVHVTLHLLSYYPIRTLLLPLLPYYLQLKYLMFANKHKLKEVISLSPNRSWAYIWSGGEGWGKLKHGILRYHPS